MNFKEFATNYLNPYLLLYRVSILSVAGFILILALSFSGNGYSRNSTFILFGICLIISVILIKGLRRHPYILYLILPLVLTAAATNIGDTEDLVSILVLLDLVLQQVAEDPTAAVDRGFNPCSFGFGSATGKLQRPV